MVLKNICTALIGMTLTWGGLAFADEYRAGDFFGLDLSTAVLSPKPLGPSNAFVPVPVEAKADRDVDAVPVRVVRTMPPTGRVAHRSKERWHAVARARPARHHTNPLNAQALDTRIQAWPCKSGGICNWKR